jgi:hypothetical protein
MLYKSILIIFTAALSVNSFGYYSQTRTDCYKSYSNSVVPGGLYTCTTNAPTQTPTTVNNYYNTGYDLRRNKQVPLHIQRQQRLSKSAEEMGETLKDWFDSR